jgi:hypothetical protein
MPLTDTTLAKEDRRSKGRINAYLAVLVRKWLPVDGKQTGKRHEGTFCGDTDLLYHVLFDCCTGHGHI